MIVVPLLVNGETIGTLNIGRMGEAEAHFTTNEFELTKLFAGQASIALQNAEAHGEVRVRAEQDALTGLRNHGAFQRELGEAVETVARAAVRGPDARPRRLQGLQRRAAATRPATPCWSEIAPAMSAATRDGDRALPLRRRRVRGDPARAPTGSPPTRSPNGSARGRRRRCPAPTRSRPVVTISVGVACFPDDGRTKDALVAVADRALYLAKPSGRRPTADGAARRPVPAGARRDGPGAARPARPGRAARDDPDPGHAPCSGRRTASSTSPNPTATELVVRHGTGLFARLRRASACRSTRGSAGEVVPDRPARWPSTTTTPGRAARRRARRACSGRSSACR